MKLDIDEYKAHREPVRLTLAARGHDAHQSIASMYAATGACPIFVVYLFVGEIVGYNEWLMKQMLSVASFYDYRQIIGQSEIDLRQFEVEV